MWKVEAHVTTGVLHVKNSNRHATKRVHAGIGVYTPVRVDKSNWVGAEQYGEKPNSCNPCCVI
jgi:hypothetical protein